MIALLAILTSIALLDSTSIIPLCIAPLVGLLAGRRPYLGAASFLAGIFVVYFGFGVLVFLLPLAAVVLVRVFFPRQSEAVFARVEQLLDRWGRIFVTALLVTLGAVLVADGVGWLAGAPLFPV